VIMPYSAKAVANEFLNLAKAEGKEITPMQMQKLVFFAYGWYLAITGERLLDERVEAWQWGPVIPSLYSEFKRFGSSPIKEPARHVEFTSGRVGLVPDRLESENPTKDMAARAIIRRVWEVYGRYSASQLSNMTHAPDSPWSKTPEKEIRGTDISDSLIREYFLALAQRQDEQRPQAQAGAGG
jgi:uncharacterized phage-associated protein